MSASEPNISLKPGQLLFRRGDPGGDLYCIDQGTVEIFVVRDGNEVIYTEMGSGEIIGVMTCLTAEPRLASARAKTEVVCHKVPHHRIQQALDRMPSWFRVVIKEYTNRLEEMNRRYSEATLGQQCLEGNQISHLYTARQLAATLAALAPMRQQNVRGKAVIEAEVAMQTAADVLSQPRSVIDRLFKVFTAAGLLAVVHDPDLGRSVIPLERLQNLVYFRNFAENTRLARNRKLLAQEFRGRESKALSALARMAKAAGEGPGSLCRLPRSRAEEALGNRPDLTFNDDTLAKAVAAGLLEQEGQGTKTILLLVPASMERIVATLAAWRRLEMLDRASGHRLEGGKQQPNGKNWHYE